jgi:hypothetical protein
VSLLWNGVPGSLPWGRDGRLRSNQISAATYTRANLHVFASAAVSVQLQWIGTCTGCGGYLTLTLNAGWNTVDVSLTGAHHGSAWSGEIESLRFQVMTAHLRTISLDWVRIYSAAAPATLHWAAPGSAAATLYWSDGGSLLAGAGTQHGGPVPSAVSGSSTDVTTTDVAGFPPGTSFYVGGSSSPVATLAVDPLPVIDSPSAAGCGDYATSALGHPWRFYSPSSARVGDARKVQFGPRSGNLTATNGPPQPADPYVLLPLPTVGIDGRTWHRLTIVLGYQGGFSLADAPGGGTLARVLWKTAGNVAYSQTNDLVTPTGTQTLTLDMAMPTSTLTEPDGSAAQRYAFASTSRVTTLRYDPNEDPGQRTWYLYSVRLAEDCSTKVATTVTWHDAHLVAGSTATVVLRTPGGHSYPVATGVAETSGANSVRVVAGRFPPSRYTVLVSVTTPAGASHVSASSGPLVVGRP